MSFFLIEDSSLINKNEIMELIPNIPFHWKKITTTEKFPMYGHVLVERPLNDDLFDQNSKISVTSPYFNYFKNIVDRFCNKHNIVYKNIIRACINSTFNVPNYIHGDPHIDFTKEHIVLIMYLNEISLDSKTIIFDIKQDYSDNVNNTPNFDVSNDDMYFIVKHEITPNFGKIVAFDGIYYHSNRMPRPGENRIICIFNLLK